MAMGVSEQIPLYVPREPFQAGELDVGDGHRLWYAQSGTPNGIPVFYLHGGPGGCSSDDHRQQFDPLKYHLIQFDQRGSGRSKFTERLQANTLNHMVSDVEQLRRHLKLDKCLILGSSWGTTIALAYAQKYPQNVAGMLLKGTFLADSETVDWMVKPDGAARFFPQEYRFFLSELGVDNPELVLPAFSNLMNSEDQRTRERAAKAWLRWEDRLGTPAWEESEHSIDDGAIDFIVNMASIMNHYINNRFFLPEKQLLHNAASLAGIPGVMVHGRYDLVCPAKGAQALQQRWPDCELWVETRAGHGGALLKQQVMRALRNFTLEQGFKRD